jgi:hypothetical protein
MKNPTIYKLQEDNYLTLSKREKQWEMQFFELKKYKEKYGHCDVPISSKPKYKRYQTLAKWCNKQRSQLSKHLHPDHVERLTEIGFTWGIRDKFFEHNFQQLKQYRKEHGHFFLKESENRSLSNWCKWIRYERGKGRLSEERIRRLTELGFEWKDLIKKRNELKWQRQFNRLQEYKKKYGHLNIATSRQNKPHLYLWLWTDTQRKLYNTNSLETDKIAKLNSIGFDWLNPASLAMRWNTQFNELKKFKEKYVHCNVSLSPKNKTYYVLANWCSTQRRQETNLTPDQVKRLTEIGFSWNIRDKLFEDKFQQLKQYREKYGHCTVKYSENQALAYWSTKQRGERKTGTLSIERVRRLTELGFEWKDLRIDIKNLKWEQQFNRLKEYKKQYGHCNVTALKYSKYLSLVPWVKTQRILYENKYNNLTSERIAKLNSIGFSWIKPATKRKRYKKITHIDLFNELKRLYALNGKPPSKSDIDKFGKYKSYAYYSRFGSIPKAREAAGISSKQDELPPFKNLK